MKYELLNVVIVLLLVAAPITAFVLLVTGLTSSCSATSRCIETSAQQCSFLQVKCTCTGINAQSNGTCSKYVEQILFICTLVGTPVLVWLLCWTCKKQAAADNNQNYQVEPIDLPQY